MCCIVKAAMQGFTQKIVQMMKEHRFFASQGGPIILSQVYNKFTKKQLLNCLIF